MKIFGDRGSWATGQIYEYIICNIIVSPRKPVRDTKGWKNCIFRTKHVVDRNLQKIWCRFSFGKWWPLDITLTAIRLPVSIYTGWDLAICSGNVSGLDPKQRKWEHWCAKKTFFFEVYLVQLLMLLCPFGTCIPLEGFRAELRPLLFVMTACLRGSLQDQAWLQARVTQRKWIESHWDVWWYIDDIFDDISWLIHDDILIRTVYYCWTKILIFPESFVFYFLRDLATVFVFSDSWIMFLQGSGIAS